MLKLFSQLLCLCLISSALGQTCITCDSSTNADCLSNATQMTGTACTGTSDCFTQIDTTSGVVTRGCSVSGTTCTSPNCLTCSGADCNKDQGICQTCNSNTDPTCVLLGPTNSIASVCKNSQCFVGVQEQATVRRCSVEADTVLCAAASGSCSLCTGVNCNNAIYPANRLKCYQCQSSATASNNCDNPTIAGSTLLPRVCNNYVANDKCYSYESSTSNFQRGCESDNLNNVCPAGTSSNLCATCSTDSCNAAGDLTCIQCRSDNDANCVNNVSGYGSVTCPATSTTDTSKCYATWYNNLFIRGCLTNAVPRIQLMCNGVNGPCKTCNTANCNFDKASGAAINTLATGILLLTAFVTLSKLMNATK